MAEKLATPLDIILPVHGHRGMTEKCVDALYAFTQAPFHLVVADDTDATISQGSFHGVDALDRTLPYFDKLLSVRNNVTYLNVDKPFRTGNQFFNFALRYCKYEYVATIMNSITVQPGWETVALQLMEQHKEVGIIGFKNLFPPDNNHAGLIESAGIDFIRHSPYDIGRDLPAHCLTEVKKVKVVQWAFALHRKIAIVGNLDDYLFHGFVGWDDIDNCMVVTSKGWAILYCGMGAGYHYPRATRGTDRPEAAIMNRENAHIFYKRWGLWKMYLEETQLMDVQDRLTPKTKEWLANTVTEYQVLNHLLGETNKRLSQLANQAIKELGADPEKYQLEMNPQLNQWILKPKITEGEHGEPPSDGNKPKEELNNLKKVGGKK